MLGSADMSLRNCETIYVYQTIYASFFPSGRKWMGVEKQKSSFHSLLFKCWLGYWILLLPVGKDAKQTPKGY